MDVLEAPWAGLIEVAATVDLWAIVRALGGPDAAAGASAAQWAAAGLPVRNLGLLGHAPRPGRWIHAAAAAWPAALDDLPFGPVALQVEGEVGRLGGAGVAVVGARACTAYGLAQSRAIARAVVDADGVVVSGLARGIDAAAHGAAGGATVAVLGQGLEVPLSGLQAEVRRRLVAAGGCVVSEFPGPLRPDRWTFPVRNRVIAGLSRVVVVVEAGRRSGARSTAAHGLRLGREVMAVPGPLGAPASEGCLDMLEEGAAMVREPATVVRAAGLTPTRSAPGSDPALAAIGTGATVDELVARTGWSVDEVLGSVGRLLLAGRVARAPGARYVPR